MRSFYMTITLLGIASGTFGQGLGSGTPTSRWFQNCEEEIAKPFCGTLKIPQIQLDPIRHDQLKPEGRTSSASSSEVSEPQQTQKVAHGDRARKERGDCQ